MPLTLEEQFEAAKLEKSAELYGWQMIREDLESPTYTMNDLFLTGLPLYLGRMQWTGHECGWALYAHVPQFREVEKFLTAFGCKFFWDMPPT
ncbi:hypothetical protein H6F86_20855 [Phormidium sp. FACHB-592]|uniref:Uncharacterized protein n=1 Tax=Stenomitos frigidus AS-A4 TaxID=2933935 RepID=A0ABV0KH71_9CYAN|nr:hypothetical protein [Phormidium sp. FACHB-592]MBD2076284.1 hypothetical protein [Phormidium sp. FACHB-592]